MLKAKKLCAVLTLLLMIYGCPCVHIKATGQGAAQTTAGQSADELTYAAYLSNYAGCLRPQEEVSADMESYSSPQNAASIITYPNAEGPYVLTAEEGCTEWKIHVEQAGLYNIKVDYYPAPGRGSDMARTLLIDGKLPFSEVRSVYFKRAFADEAPVYEYKDGEYRRTLAEDKNGNEIRPSQIEQPQPLSAYITDVQGYTVRPFFFYFTQGEHTIGLDAIREPLAVKSITLCSAPVPKPYAEVSAAYDTAQKQVPAIEIQGEYASLKSDQMIYAVSDVSSPATVPSSAKAILLNTIGGAKWQTNQQWISWEFYVPQTGLYKLNIKARQNVVAGQSVFRNLYIDKEIPFAELEGYEFHYSSGWKNVTLGAEEPFLFMLTEGRHTLKMEVTLGELASFANHLDDIIDQLTAIYTEFLVVIGPNPDVNRDYHFEELFPQSLKTMLERAAELEDMFNDYVNITGTRGQQTQILLNTANILRRMANDPFKIASLFSSFNQNISSLASFLSVVKQQPLEIDYMTFSAPDSVPRKATGGFFDNIAFAVKQFFYSFTADYSDMGSTGSSDITVWLGNGATTSGRDQANVLSQMVKNSFSAQNNINVNLQLVPQGALLSATLAGKGPDVALSVAQADPINYAIRGAVSDVSSFGTFDEVKKRFASSAMTPLTFMDKVYGLPETQSFPVMFYRTDIFDELGLQVPQTWDDVIEIIPLLQTKNLQFGLQLPYVVGATGAGFSPFTTLLYQNGGELYTQNGERCLLNTKNAVNAFFKWTDFYSQYSLLTAYDFLTRFRFGEMPICINDYGAFNSLSVFAPELTGKWDIALVPGTVGEDGEINRTVASSVTACMVMSACQDPDAAWKFLDWWTSADMQQQFGRELESIMGPAGRYQTANIEALQQIPWNTSDFELLRTELSYTKGIPEVPGSYIAPRYVDFAFKQAVISPDAFVLSNSTDPGQILMDISKLVNDELANRRAEFGITG